MNNPRSKICTLLRFFILAICIGQSKAEETPLNYQTAAIQTEQLSGVLYQPARQQPLAAIVVLGGSGGRLNTVYPEILTEQGFVVLALAYFKAPGLPTTLDEVPVETVSRALDFLEQIPEVDQRGGFGVLGVSRGSELALLAGAYDQRIRAVAAIVPSSVAWHGQTGPAAWTVDTQPVSSLSFARRSEQPILLRAQQALSTTPAVQAQLPVERISGPLLLISASQDHIWPSTAMARQLVERLKTHDFAHPVNHLILMDDHSLDQRSVAQLKQPLIELFSVLPTD